MKLTTFRRLFLLFLTANAFAIAGNAQVQFGVKGGINIAELLTSSDQEVYVGGNPQEIRNFPRTVLYGGVFLSIPLSAKYSFQPELVFSEQGATGKPSTNFLVSSTEDYRFNWLNIPLLLKYNLPMGFYAETGPQVGILVNAEVDQTVVGAVATSYYNVNNQLKSTDLEWTLGGGFISPINLGFDIRYNLGLTDFNNTTLKGTETAPVQNKSVRNGVLQFGVFYLFGKAKAQAEPKVE